MSVEQVRVSIVTRFRHLWSLVRSRTEPTPRGIKSNPFREKKVPTDKGCTFTPYTLSFCERMSVVWCWKSVIVCREWVMSQVQVVASADKGIGFYVLVPSRKSGDGLSRTFHDPTCTHHPLQNFHSGNRTFLISDLDVWPLLHSFSLNLY